MLTRNDSIILGWQKDLAIPARFGKNEKNSVFLNNNFKMMFYEKY